MKKIIITLIILTSIIAIKAQTPKYNDIIEAVKEKKYAETYTLLLEYQHQKPEFPNTYFQLGNISYNWAMNSDPLTDIKQSEYYIYNTKLFYNLCLSKLEKQPKDGKKNEEYYKTIPEMTNIQTKLDNIIITEFIKKRLEKINEYDINAKKISNLFNKLVNSYNKTLDIFVFIINNYNNLSDIYIQPQQTIIEKTNELTLMYDSTLFYYQQYKTAINNYPIKNYKQKIIPKQINTYRLQGITGTNFLKNEIPIWNFKDWAIKIQTQLNKNIKHFRQTITKTQKELKNKENELSKTQKFSNSYKKYTLDQTVIFEIEKYDYNSIITTLFEYITTKIKFLVQYRRNFNDKNNTNPLTISNRMTELYELINTKIIADSLLNKFSKKINKNNYQKHKTFFDNNYKNINELKNFTKQQQQDLNSKIQETTENIKFFTYRDLFHEQINNNSVKYKNTQINLFNSTTAPETAAPNKYYTIDIAEFKTIKYIGGFFKTTTKATPFIAKIENNEVKWVKTYPTAGTTAFIAKIQANSSGCIAIIYSNDNNNLIKISTDGKQSLNIKTNTENIPRTLIYDEINNNTTITYQGKNINYYTDNDKTATIQNININTKNIEWTKKITLTGKIINIIKIESNYHIFANYNNLKFDEKTFSSQNNSKIINIKTDLKGNLINAKNINSTKFIYGIAAQKINNNTIGIIGLTAKTDLQATKLKNLPKAEIIFLSPNNKIHYQN